MARDKGQLFMFNKNELATIKKVFNENEGLVYALRSLFLQFPLNDGQKKLLRKEITPEVFAVIKKRVHPEIGPDFPLTQQAHILTTIGQDLKTKGVDECEPLIASMALSIQYLDERFNALTAIMNGEEPAKPEVVLADLAKIGGRGARGEYVFLRTYLFLLGYIDPAIQMLVTIAGQKEESPEQQAERMSRNSTK